MFVSDQKTKSFTFKQSMSFLKNRINGLYNPVDYESSGSVIVSNKGFRPIEVLIMRSGLVMRNGYSRSVIHHCLTDLKSKSYACLEGEVDQKWGEGDGNNTRIKTVELYDAYKTDEMTIIIKEIR